MEQQPQGGASNAALQHIVAESEASEAQEIEHPLLEQAVQKMQMDLDTKLEEIREDRRLTKEEQREKIAQTWERAQEFHARAMKQYEDVLAADVEEAEDKLFHVGTNRDAVRSAYNDVRDRTKFLRDLGDFEEAREELEHHAQRARRTGDKALRTAVGHLATEWGEDELRDAWLATSEEKTKAWNDFTEARLKQEHYNNPQERFVSQLTRNNWNLRKPEEL